MKLSDYVARFLQNEGVRHVFVVTGGASIHLIHSVDDTPGIAFVCTQHEQAAAMAADAYSRVTQNLGAAMTTSGPGATNLITGICGAYYDSVPVIYITGQTATFRMRGSTGVRQIGFQETDTIDIVKPITKYAVQIDDPKRIRFELEKACYLARANRPGPVLLDIPDNIQRAQIQPEQLPSFVPQAGSKNVRKQEDEIQQCVKFIRSAKRPVLILGWGVRLAKAEAQVLALIHTLGFPAVATWAVADILPSTDPFWVGTFGTHGTRYANFAVQNADLILSIGSRLDTKATGSPITTFARQAKKIVIDIDSSELGKYQTFGLKMDLLIESDAKDFVQALNSKLSEIEIPDIAAWMEQIKLWQTKYPICLPEYYDQEEVNPYVFVKTLSENVQEGATMVVDTGSTLAWMMQAFDFKRGQRLYHDWNNTAMGWALPASIAACLALPNTSVICVTGDGSLQMNIQELATIQRHQLPIKLFLINNRGYSMIQQTQDQWMDSKYLASSIEGGLAFPNFLSVAKAYGFKTVAVSENRMLQQGIQETLKLTGPVFCNIDISPQHRVTPQGKFGRPNEDQEPLLERSEFLRNMIVKPMDVSLKLD